MPKQIKFKKGDRIQRLPLYCKGLFDKKENVIYTVSECSFPNELYLKEFGTKLFDTTRFKLVSHSCSKPSWL